MDFETIIAKAVRVNYAAIYTLMTGQRLSSDSSADTTS